MATRRGAVLQVLDRADARMRAFMAVHGVTALRLALGAVFVWFGALKVIGRSPVEELVRQTVYWVPGDLFVPLLGVWEVMVGLGLLSAVLLRLTLLLFFAQMAGTFLVFLVKSEAAFQDGNPLLLTATGEFIMKNIVLVAAGIVVGSTVRRRREEREGRGVVLPQVER